MGLFLLCFIIVNVVVVVVVVVVVGYPPGHVTTSCTMEVVQLSRGLFCGHAVTPLCQQLSHRHGVRPQIQG